MADVIAVASRRRGPVVDHLDLECLIGAGHGRLDVCARRVLKSIGECLLQYPVAGQIDARREPRRIAVYVEVNV